MQTVELNDILKASAEVTSLSNTDKVQIVDVNGVPKKASKDLLKDVVSFTPTPGTWYRILTLGAGGRSSVGEFVLEIAPFDQECFSVRWAIPRTSYWNKSQISIFNPGATFASSKIPKIRCVRPSSSGLALYIDIFASGSQLITIRLGACVNTAFNYVESPEIPSGYTAFEIDMTQIGGG